MLYPVAAQLLLNTVMDSSPEFEADKALVIELLMSAFDSNGPPPEEVALDRSDRSGGADLDATFRGKRWVDAMVADVALCRFHGPLFTARGFHYYLPAYILRTLEDPETTDLAMDMTIYTLEGSVLGTTAFTKPPNFFDDGTGVMFGLFTTAQSRAVLAFVEFYMKYFSIEFEDEKLRALREFWLNRSRGRGSLRGRGACRRSHLADGA